MANMTFDPSKDIPDLTGKIILITGGKLRLTQKKIRKIS
jgi:hypothetical protein